MQLGLPTLSPEPYSVKEALKVVWAETTAAVARRRS